VIDFLWRGPRRCQPAWAQPRSPKGSFIPESAPSRQRDKKLSWARAGSGESKASLFTSNQTARNSFRCSWASGTPVAVRDMFKTRPRKKCSLSTPSLTEIDAVGRIARRRRRRRGRTKREQTLNQILEAKWMVSAQRIWSLYIAATNRPERPRLGLSCGRAASTGTSLSTARPGRAG